MSQIGSWEQYTPGNYTEIPIPAGTVNIQIECRGSGGSGRCGGGGGGAYARKTIPFVANMTLSAVVADAAQWDHGWTTSVSTNVGIVCSAPGGGKCKDDEVTGGDGANASDCVGDICFGGGKGGNFVQTSEFRGAGGGGGGSGRPVAAGSSPDGDWPGNYGGGRGGSSVDYPTVVPPDPGHEGGGGGGYFKADMPTGGCRGGRGWACIKFFDS